MNVHLAAESFQVEGLLLRGHKKQVYRSGSSRFPGENEKMSEQKATFCAIHAMLALERSKRRKIEPYNGTNSNHAVRLSCTILPILGRQLRPQDAEARVVHLT